MPRPKSDIQPRLLEAAAQRFIEEGVDGASLRAIARDAGTNIGMLYYYFPTKDALFQAVVEQAYQVILRDLEVALAPGRSTKERVQGLFVRIAALSDDELRIVRIILREALVFSPRLEALVQRFSRGHVGLIIAALQDGLRAGEIDPSLPMPVLLVAVGTLAGVPQIALRVARERLPWSASFLPSPEAMAALCFKVLMRGIAPDGDPRHPQGSG